MKYSFLVIGATLLFASCKNDPKSTDTTTIESVDTNKLRVDTIGLAEFKATKAQQERDSLQRDSIERANALAKKTETKHKSTNSTRSYNHSNNAVSNNNSSSTEDHTSTAGDISSESGNTAEAKKGWSKTAKGAVIGGVVGAGTGAVINKKHRGKGAIIGGVVGAGAGAIIGRDQDKKDGRRQ